MRSTPAELTVRDILELKKNGMLISNPEYQRGSVWQADQKKRLVDSLLREYPLPLIYLHRRHLSVAGMTRDALEVIDGQQRTNALSDFHEGAFKLFDPVKDAAEARFPSFIQAEPCPWAGSNFDSLPDELKEKFLTTKLSVVYVDTEVANEARDLFIRLQAGLPLNAQEKRDAWPGRFTEFVLKFGGKPELARYPGHDFFTVAMKTKANGRGEVRQLTAQMMMLFLSRKVNGKLCDINRNAIDDFYYQNLDFDLLSTNVKRFEIILDILEHALRDGKRKKLQGYEAIGLILLVDSLLDDYAPGWKDSIGKSFDEFRHTAAIGARTKWDSSPDEYWSKYGILARANTDRSETIERRHNFFSAKMLSLIQPKPLDPTRSFVGIERELIYYRDGKRCQRCGDEVTWSDSEIHHVVLHSKGGSTSLWNGALMHKACHPKTASDVAQFAEQWKAKLPLEAVVSSPAS